MSELGNDLRAGAAILSEPDNGLTPRSEGFVRTLETTSGPIIRGPALPVPATPYDLTSPSGLVNWNAGNTKKKTCCVNQMPVCVSLRQSNSVKPQMRQFSASICVNFNSCCVSHDFVCVNINISLRRSASVCADHNVKSVLCVNFVHLHQGLHAPTCADMRRECHTCTVSSPDTVLHVIVAAFGHSDQKPSAVNSDEHEKVT
ncbi:hypothetical protein GGX14DRAFT_397645 [Mycena pura]|uniref:Uncharacterized protein n=1 Tax=Mycena pura TaxID=153505 RepID=A0AAD6VC78_9AGAR|nr:hypothetical protein GGX14DRAFT_397645 [Mycena pura]